MKSCAVLLVICVVLGVATGCRSSSAGNVYSASQARTAHSIRIGVVQSVRPVVIEGTKSPIGAIAGGVLGGVVGSTMGGGSGKRVATTAGALVGAGVGAVAEEAVTRQQAWEMFIRFDNGETLGVTQAKGGESFYVGQQVEVWVDGSNTTRARPHTPPPPPPQPTPAAAAPATEVQTPVRAVP